MATLKFIIRTAENKDGSYSIRLRVSKNKETFFVPTTCTIFNPDKCWDKAKGGVTKACPNGNELNFQLTELKQKVQRQIFDLERDNPGISALQIRDIIQRKEADVDFIKMFRAHIETKRTLNSATYLTFHTHLHNIEEYINGRRLKAGEDSKPLPIHKITPYWLADFQRWCLEKKGLVQNTVGTHLTDIRTIILQAIANKYIKREANPFLEFKVSRGDRKKKIPLTAEEVEAIRTLATDERLDWWSHHTKNAFIFAHLNAGMRTSDVTMLRWRDVTNQFYTPRKTKNKMKVLPLLPNTISLAILKEYEHRNTSPDAFVFPFMDRELKWAETKEHAEMYKIKDTTRYLNTALKKLARCAGINKDISTHIARHSFAYKAMQGGLTAVQLQGLFNHSSTQITQSYMNNIMNADYTKGLLDRAVGA